MSAESPSSRMRMASSAEPTRDVSVAGAGSANSSPALGLGDHRQRHEQAPVSSSSGRTSLGSYESRSQQKILSIVNELQDTLSTRRKSASRETISGADIVTALRERHQLTKPSAMHLLYLISSLGYLVHVPGAAASHRQLDERLQGEKYRYRFQIYEYWPLRLELNTDQEYACYLYRVNDLSARSVLLDYELEALECLKTHLEASWVEIKTKAHSRRKYLKSLAAEERHNLYLCERKFWRVVRPAPLSACPLMRACHPWQEKDSHLRLLQRTKGEGDGMSYSSRASSSSSHPSEDRRRSRSTGSRDHMRRTKVLKTRCLDSASLPAIVSSRSQSNMDDHSRASMERNALWLQSLQNPGKYSSQAGKGPSLEMVTGRKEKELQSVVECEGEGLNEVLPPQAERPDDCAAARELSPRTTLATMASSEGTASRVSSPSPDLSRFRVSGSHSNASSCPGSPTHLSVGNMSGDGSHLSSSTVSIMPITSEELIDDELNSLEYRLRQPYLPIHRIIEVNNKLTEERRDIDMLLASSVSNTQNPWVSSHADPVSDGSVVTAHQCRLWATSFETMLYDPRGHLEFEQFLEKEFAAENIAFWKEAEVYRNLPSSSLAERAEILYGNFILQNCLQQINIPASVHMDIRKQLEKCATRYMFDAAQRQVYHLMRKDSYPRFLQSQQFKDLQSQAPIRTHSSIFRSLRIRRTSASPGLARTSLSGSVPRDIAGESRSKSPSTDFSRFSLSKAMPPGDKSTRASSADSDLFANPSRHAKAAAGHHQSVPIEVEASPRAAKARKFSAPAHNVLHVSRSASPAKSSSPQHTMLDSCQSQPLSPPSPSTSARPKSSSEEVPAGTLKDHVHFSLPRHSLMSEESGAGPPSSANPPSPTHSDRKSESSSVFTTSSRKLACDVPRLSVVRTNNTEFVVGNTPDSNTDLAQERGVSADSYLIPLSSECSPAEGCNSDGDLVTNLPGGDLPEAEAGTTNDGRGKNSTAIATRTDADGGYAGGTPPESGACAKLLEADRDDKIIPDGKVSSSLGELATSELSNSLAKQPASDQNASDQNALQVDEDTYGGRDSRRGSSPLGFFANRSRLFRGSTSGQNDQRRKKKQRRSASTSDLFAGMSPENANDFCKDAATPDSVGASGPSSAPTATTEKGKRRLLKVRVMRCSCNWPMWLVLTASTGKVYPPCTTVVVNEILKKKIARDCTGGRCGLRSPVQCCSTLNSAMCMVMTVDTCFRPFARFLVHYGWPQSDFFSGLSFATAVAAKTLECDSIEYGMILFLVSLSLLHLWAECHHQYQHQYSQTRLQRTRVAMNARLQRMLGYNEYILIHAIRTACFRYKVTWLEHTTRV